MEMCRAMPAPGLTFQVDDLPVPAVDASVGAPPAKAPRGQREEEEVPRLGLSHPVGDDVEVLSQQPLAEEEPCRGHCPSHCLGTQLCFRATGALGTPAVSLTAGSSHTIGGLSTAWVQVSVDGNPLGRGCLLQVLKHPWVPRKRQGGQDVAQLCQG